MAQKNLIFTPKNNLKFYVPVVFLHVVTSGSINFYEGKPDDLPGWQCAWGWWGKDKKVFPGVKVKKNQAVVKTNYNGRTVLNKRW